MPNALFKQLAALGKPKRPKIDYPYTLAIDKSGAIIGRESGVKTLRDFPGAKFLNIVHRNGKTTVVTK